MRRRQAFEMLVDGASDEVVPLTVESFGRLGKEEARFLNDRGDVAAEDGCVCKAALTWIVHQELSCALF